MKSCHLIIIASLLASFSGAAHAILIDLKAGADSIAVDSITDQNQGEKGYSILSYDLGGGNALSITGTSDADNDPDQFAYMDKNRAGLGVCKDLDTAAQCTPASDDNVTGSAIETETLHFVFDVDVTINKIWFNNNHDPDRSLVGDTISIGSVDYLFGLTDIDASRSSGSTSAYGTGFAYTDFVYDVPIVLGAGSVLDLAFFNEQFYVSAIDFDVSVPEPGILGLLAIGLVGFGAAVRRRRT